jgi:hypothetical protein
MTHRDPLRPSKSEPTNSAGRHADSTTLPEGGEDDASTEIEGDDSHLHDDQKAPTFNSGA